MNTLEKFTFTDLSGTERTLKFFEITLCKRTENGSLLLEWLGDSGKCYCFVDDPQAEVIEQSLIEWVSKTEPAAPSHRHPLFPKHDQIKVEIVEGGTLLLDARRFISIKILKRLDGTTHYAITYDCGLDFITEKCYNNLKKYLVDRNAILDLDEGDM